MSMFPAAEPASHCRTSSSRSSGGARPIRSLPAALQGQPLGNACRRLKWQPGLLLLAVLTLSGCGSLSDPAAPETARWVFSQGGTVTLEGDEVPIGSESKLPEVSFALAKIDLNGTGVTDADLSRLVDLKYLKSLVLHSTAVTDAGLPALAPLTTLEELELSYTSVTDESLSALHGMRNLKRLFVRGTTVTPEAAQSFEQTHPGARVYLD